ncbi:imelysin family protein [Rhodobacteraceae bacterium D3-12]|nr:imelysin family protein [Rhodobacteraceae bacterium D3-12]
MIRHLVAIAVFLFPAVAQADGRGAVLEAVVKEHVLPRFEQLSARSGALHQAATAECSASSEGLQQAYHAAFDAWVGVSHLRFGPSEVNDRAFALAFWPDTKGFTPKALARLIRNQDSAAQDVEAFSHVSIAGRGFYALEFLLFDERIASMGDATYRCDLVRAVTADIERNAGAILSDWRGGYGEALMHPGADGRYRSEDEAVQEVFKALLVGLEFTQDTRLGRPLGTFERPRPKRAEAYRSGRSLRNVVVSVEATRELAAILSRKAGSVADTLDAAFARSLELAAGLGDPVFAGVATIQGRLEVEILQQSIGYIREIANTELGPMLGVSAGFNALDGD